MLVDDEVHLLDCLSLFLEDSGYQVYTAADGSMALKVFSACEPDVVVSDLYMPHMDGLELRRRLLQQPAWQRVPFILLTGRSDKNNGDPYPELDIHAYVHKPFKVDELLRVLERTR